jgi:trans-2,3-dihydro-3-hydroxyanthranilate isomerase
MGELTYFVVDVFTEIALAGNPLAVVIDSVGLATEQMQAIAREFNLSETTFVERRPAAVEQEQGVRVRIFTTEEELPFAGHPTLGTASVLKLSAPESIEKNIVTLHLNVGRIPVRFEKDGLFGEMTQRDPEFGAELDGAEVAPLIGLAVDDMDTALPPQIVSTGNPFAIVLLRSAESLARLNVKQQEATTWLRERGARWFYVFAPAHLPGKGSPQEYRARMQFNGGEDPATGSAAGCAISYLVAHGVVPSGTRVALRQGLEMGRPSELMVSAKLHSAKVTDVRVAGSTVLVATGQLFLR